MAQKKRELTDPRAIRALAHPARLRVIDELYNGKVLTATECAKLADLTPSAMSYHLRALERWGIVERAEESADGRERPWRAPADRVVISTQSSGAGRLAGQALMRSSVDRILEQFQELPATDPWDDVSSMSRSRLWLTYDETGRFNQELEELVERYRLGRTPTSHPAGARQISTLLAVVPTGDPPANTGPAT